MDTERYNELFQDKNVVKFNCQKIIGKFFISQNELLVVDFIFDHENFKFTASTYPDKRLILKVYLYEKFNNKENQVLIKINREVMVLLNSNDKDYALTFRIKVDEDELSAEVKLVDWPQVASNLITKEEIDGIRVMVKDS